MDGAMPRYAATLPGAGMHVGYLSAPAHANRSTFFFAAPLRHARAGLSAAEKHYLVPASPSICAARFAPLTAGVRFGVRVSACSNAAAASSARPTSSSTSPYTSMAGLIG